VTGPRERETVITQEIPVKVLHETAVEGLHEPRCRDPDVHIILPSLAHLKSISERFSKLAGDARPAASSGIVSSTLTSPKLELSANMHGSLKLAIATDALRISSVWSDLVNPPLDPAQMSQSEIEQLPSERMRALGSDDEAGWAKVRIDSRDWSRVLSIGRLSPKVVACELSCVGLYACDCTLVLIRLLSRFYPRDGPDFVCLLTGKLEWGGFVLDSKFPVAIFQPCHY
jgi:HUS1 checkpoint protein